MKSTSLLLGAHVSTSGGIHQTPERGREIGANCIQIFTKTPNRWREPKLTRSEIEAFKRGLAEHSIAGVVSHDSYLINLASPDRRLRAMSIRCFEGELTRCSQLGVKYIVTHPGNYMDNREDGIVRNAAAYQECLNAVSGPSVLIETTAGAGTALGARLEELAELRERVSGVHRARIEFCADTCHLFSAGYDLVGDWDSFWQEWDRVIGLDHLKCLHLNDSKVPFGSHRDRHELIGEGTLGPEPFKRVMKDERFTGIIKVIETPKLDDAVKTDTKMLRRLKSYASKKGQVSN